MIILSGGGFLVLLQQASEVVEFAILTGSDSNPVYPVAVAVFPVAVTVFPVAVTVSPVAVTVSLVAVTVSPVAVFVPVMTVWFPTMPVNVDRATHGEGDCAAKGASVQMKRVVLFREFLTLVEPVAL